VSLVGGGIPFVMTAKLKAALRARGLTDEAIAQMTPGDAHKLLMTDEERAARAIVKLRRRVLAAGFNPIPLAGKLPVLKAWQKHDGVSDLEISTWSTRYPLATNTGILTATAPALDIDILDPDAAAAVEALVKARFEDGATVPVRFGHFPQAGDPVSHGRPVREDRSQPSDRGRSGGAKRTAARIPGRRATNRHCRRPPRYGQALHLARRRAGRDQAQGPVPNY
jgi:Bifunctional DNA primase/polymerase, N-terminal